MKDYIFFDLDGTLTDSAEGIFNSLRNALDFFNIKKTDDELRVFIGPPLRDSFLHTMGFSDGDTQTAVAKFHEYYETKGLFENKPYSGIRIMLEKLKSAGKHLVVATSKPELISRRILNHFEFSSLFDHICGSNMDETRSDKAEVIAYAMESCGLGAADAERVIMVGDRHNDIDGAHKNGIKAVAVLYGYGSRKEFEECNADYIIETVGGLEKFLEVI